VPTIQIPDYARLPETLYGDVFSLAVDSNQIHPAQRNAPGLYLFHDGKWFADARHMLGWSREVIHSLQAKSWVEATFKKNRLYPDWLCGHAFQLQANGKYQVSGDGRQLETGQLIELASQAQVALEAADVKIDQWGAAGHMDWLRVTAHHVQAKADAHPIVAHILGERNHLEVHTLMANWGNQVHHPKYPK
jgi:hypothetical protein